MIDAKKNAAFDRLFRQYNKHLLRKHFSAMHAAGIQHIAGLDRAEPIIMAGNHSCWWDGLVEYYLAREVIDCNVYLMMEEKQMTRYKFFRRIGAFSVRRESPRDAVRSMRYAASLFRMPDVWLWIYPQGIMKPNDVRPLRFFPGVARIIQMTGRSVQVVPFARRYEFLLSQRPEVFTLFGDPIIAGSVPCHKTFTRELEISVTTLLERLRSTIARGDTAQFRTILRGASSSNERFDAIRMK